MVVHDLNSVLLLIKRAKCTFNIEMAGLLNEESISGVCSDRVSL